MNSEHLPSNLDLQYRRRAVSDTSELLEFEHRLSWEMGNLDFSRGYDHP